MTSTVEEVARELVEELKAITKLRWRARSFDADDLQALAELLRRGGGDTETERWPDELREVLRNWATDLEERERESPPAHGRSLAIVARTLLMLDDRWLDKKLAERRDFICERWQREDGKGSIGGHRSFATNFEADAYVEMASDLAEWAYGSPKTVAAEADDETGSSKAGKRHARFRGVPSWPGSMRPATGQDVVVLIASQRMRQGPSSPLVRLVREFEPYWRHTRPMIYAVEGSYKAIWRHGLLHDYTDRDDSNPTGFVCLRPGYRGGLVEAANIVIASELSYTPNTCVIYLTHPSEPASLFPEALALKRECILSGADFLCSYYGAARFLALAWASAMGNSRQRHKDHQLLLDRAHVDDPRLDEGIEERMALAAHDRHKPAMVEFAQEFAEFLTDDFETRYATASTGHLLNGGSLDSISEDLGLFAMRHTTREELLNAIEGAQRRVAATDPAPGELGTDGWADLLPHGRRGGVLQLAREVLGGRCSTIAFFQDAETPREHDMDMQVLDRAVQLPETNCLLLHSRRSAGRWAGYRDALRDDGQDLPSPISLVEAYRRVFDVELVLAHPPAGTDPRRHDHNDTWAAVVSTASTYIVNAVTAALQRRSGTPEPARIGFSWGTAIREVVEDEGESETPRGLAAGLELHRLVETHPPQGLVSVRENVAAWPPRSPSPDRPATETELHVLPTVGLVGSDEGTVEAQAIVEQAARQLGGKPIAYPGFAFEFGTHARNGDSPALLDEWSKLDLMVCNCDKVRPPGDRVMGFPAKLYQQVRDAVGVFGTIYLEQREDTIVESSYGASFRQTGIPFDQVVELAGPKRPQAEVILVAGRLEERQQPARAALKAKLVSTLIADPKFAWELLGSELKGQPLKS